MYYLTSCVIYRPISQCATAKYMILLQETSLFLKIVPLYYQHSTINFVHLQKQKSVSVIHVYTRKLLLCVSKPSLLLIEMMTCLCLNPRHSDHLPAMKPCSMKRPGRRSATESKPFPSNQSEV